jgi:putative membrane protein
VITDVEPQPPRRIPRRAGLWDVFFAIRGSIVRVIAWKVGILTLVACAVVYWSKHHGDPIDFGAQPFAFVGISISVFMSFRNSACFDRWWEARKQWGRLIVCARSLARETRGIVPAPDRQEIMQGVCAYARSLSARLRGMSEAAAAPAGLDPDQYVGPNPTNQVLERIGEKCSSLATRGIVSEWRYMLMENRLTEMCDVQAACERISNTPLPFAYTLLIHRTTYMFCGLLPFGLAAHLGWGTPVLVTVVSYAFFGLDAIGNELEDPFGPGENALPLGDFIQTIEREIAKSADIAKSEEVA